MMSHKQQNGVGLIEVLVSILLLSVAVMGFSALQMTSVKSTDESLKRTQGMSIARGLAESLRINPQSITKIQAVINSPTTEAGLVTRASCQGIEKPCTSEELAIRDALTVVENAKDYDVNIGMETCAGTEVSGVGNSEVACIVVSWNTTNPSTDRSTRTSLGTEYMNCADSNAVYYANADCIILEAY